MNNVLVSAGKRLFFLRNYSWGRCLLKCLAYPFILWFLFLSKMKGANYFAIKGSFTRTDWVFGLSDIDLVVIFPQSISTEKRQSVTKRLQWWQGVFPFIGDIDYFRDGDFSLWQVLGGVKALQSRDWKWIGKMPQQRKYLYHPLKFRLNVIQELGFLHEWLEYNYFHADQNEYRIQALSRVLKKILLNIDWLVGSKTFFPSMDEMEGRYPFLWKKIASVENKEQALQCYFLIGKSFYLEINSLLESIPKEIKAEFQVSMTRETKLDLDNIFFRNYWVLLKCSGYFNPDILIRFCEYADDPFAQTIILGMVHCRLIEGFGFEDRINNPYLDTLRSDIKRHPLYEHIQPLADNMTFLGESPVPFKSDVALVTSTWGPGESHLKSLLKAHDEWRKQKKSFVHIHIVMSDEPPLFRFPSDLFVFHIKSDELNHGLWHKESLQNIGGYLARFQKIMIFLDSDVYSDNPSYIDRMEAKLNEEGTDLVQGFSLVKDTLDESYQQFSWVSQYKKQIEYWRAPGLIWGMKKETFNQMRGLNPLVPEGSNDGAFVSEILGINFGHASSFSWFKDSLRRLPRIYNVDFLDLEVIHINHGKAREYINRPFFLELLTTPLRNSLELNYLGILKWKEKDSDAKKVLYLAKFHESHSTREFCIYFNSLIAQKICKIEAPFRFFSSELPLTEVEFFYLNYGFINSLGSGRYEFAIPAQSCANVDFIFKSQIFTLKAGEVLRGKLKLDSPGIQILKVRVEDKLFGRTFADIKGTEVELKNYLDTDISFQLHIFLSTLSGEVYQLDLSGLKKEVAACHPPVMAGPVSRTFPILEEMLSYFCKDQSSQWTKFGNGFDIHVQSSTTHFYQHNIRLDLTTLPVQHGSLSFLLESTFNIELEIFVEDKEGYCLLLTDCSHFKFLAGKHLVQYDFSWSEKVNFPNLYILFRCESPGEVKFHELILKI